jgi:hypothetical protein
MRPALTQSPYINCSRFGLRSSGPSYGQLKRFYLIDLRLTIKSLQGLRPPRPRSFVAPYRLGCNKLDEEIIGIGTTRHQGRNGRIPLLIGLCGEQVATTQRHLRRRQGFELLQTQFDRSIQSLFSSLSRRANTSVVSIAFT